MVRDLLIVNHTGFPRPLWQGLEARGVATVEQVWEPDDTLLSRSLGCVVWFYDCLRHPYKIWRLRQRLARHGVPLFAWNRDAPHYLNRKPWRLDLLNRFRLLDIYATHTLADERRQFADTVLYFPNAADVESYGLGAEEATTLAAMRNAGHYEWDVSFFGAMDGTRYKEMLGRQVFFESLSLHLQERGIHHLFREAGDMTVKNQVQLIQCSRINLNFGASCEYGAPFASGLPERCYGIPAAGGFLLCDRRTHARDDFAPGHNWAEFDGVDDCVSQIEHWLSHFEAARDLAERCHHHVMENHTYAHRAERLHRALLDWHGGRRGLIK